MDKSIQNYLVTPSSGHSALSEDCEGVLLTAGERAFSEPSHSRPLCEPPPAPVHTWLPPALSPELRLLCERDVPLLLRRFLCERNAAHVGYVKGVYPLEQAPLEANVASVRITSSANIFSIILTLYA